MFLCGLRHRAANHLSLGQSVPAVGATTMTKADAIEMSILIALGALATLAIMALFK